jgi:hypothetical protein
MNLKGFGKNDPDLMEILSRNMPGGTQVNPEISEESSSC